MSPHQLIERFLRSEITPEEFDRLVTRLSDQDLRTLADLLRQQTAKKKEQTA